MNGTESGLETVFTAQFGLVWFVALIFGALFAYACRQARRWGFLPSRPMSTATFVIIGVAVTGFLAGFIIGWERTVKLALVFLASGIPQVVENVFANLDADKKVLREKVHMVDMDDAY